MSARAKLGAALVALLCIGGSAPRAQQARDATNAPAPVGQAEISGVVVTTTDPVAPIARVLVTISGDNLPPGRTVITDADGRFAFRNLPAGTFTIVAARAPFIRTEFGARRPARPGTPIVLAAGERVTDAVIRLARGAAITGLVRHPDGEPAAGVTVDVMPLDTQARPGVPIVTDDRGVYRAFGLAPGRYVVSAKVADTTVAQFVHTTDEDMDAILARLAARGSGGAMSPVAGVATPARGASAPPATPPAATYGLAPIFYPGTPDPGQAEPVVVAEGQERLGVDLDLQIVRLGAIDGRVSAPGRALPASTRITRTPIGGRRDTGALTVSTDSQPGPEGAYHMSGVVPGRYRVVARAVEDSSVLWALADVTVDAGITTADLVLQPGLVLTGRVAFDGVGAPPPATSLRLGLVDVTGVEAFQPGGVVRADGTFEIRNVMAGRYSMTATVAGGSAWRLRSVTIGGRDILDTPLELVTAADLSSAVVTLTDRPTELSGTLQSATGLPAPEHFIVALSPNRAHWWAGTRRIRFVRPGTDGRYVFSDLPPGEYVIAALTDMEPSDLLDPPFLETLLPAGVAVRIDEGGRTVQDLRIGRE